MKRSTIEMRAIATRFQEQAPPPAGAGLREWFAGLALANVEMMKDVPHTERPVEAVRLADELISALAKPRIPTLESMKAPTTEELVAWENSNREKEEKKARMSRATMPELPAIRARNSARPPATVVDDFGSIATTAIDHFKAATRQLKVQTPGTYFHVGEDRSE